MPCQWGLLCKRCSDRPLEPLLTCAFPLALVRLWCVIENAWDGSLTRIPGRYPISTRISLFSEIRQAEMSLITPEEREISGKC